MTLTGVHKPDKLLDALTPINMRLVIIGFVYLLPGLLELANVDASGRASVLLEKLSQLVELVPDVGAGGRVGADRFEEGLNRILTRLILLLFLESFLLLVF